jgi:hypothetical protein
MQSYTRIVGTIAAKDIVEAFKNKVTLGIMIGTAVLMLNGMVLPLLLGLRDTPVAIVYDPTRSTRIRALITREEFRLRLADSAEEVQIAVGEAAEVMLGLVLPPDFADGETLDIEGYIVHWAKPAEVAEIVAFFEEQLSRATWQEVHIHTEGNVVYPPSDSGGQPFMLSMTLTIVILTLGLALVPILLLDEKESHTLDALLVSPARLDQVMMGKAIVGIFYCLIACAVALALNHKYIVHWGAVLLPIVLGALFASGLGLLLSSWLDNAATINLWMTAVLLVLLVPMLMIMVNSSKISPAIQETLAWTPSVLISSMLKATMAGTLWDAPLLGYATALLGITALVYALIGLRVRGMDR